MAKKNPCLQFDKYNCRIVAKTDDFMIIVPLDWECAQFMNSFDCGGEGSKWCIGDSKYYCHWNSYLERKYYFYFVYFINRNQFYGRKLMIYHNQKKKEFFISDQNDKIFHVPVFNKCNAAKKANVRSIYYCDIFLQIFEFINNDTNNIHSEEKPRWYREGRTIQQRIEECCRYKRKILNLIGVEYYYIPENIVELTWLKELRLKIQKGQLLPDLICRLKNLEKIDLTITDLLPEALRHLTWIKSLSLTGDFSVLPDWIGDLTGLQVLEISSDNLSGLPKSMQNLTSLKKLVLKIGGNFLSTPTWPEKIITLEELEIYVFSFYKQPPFKIQGIFPHLKKLKLRGWSTLPEWKCNTHIEELEISHCDCTEIPEWIGSIKSLRKLNIACNHFQTIPDSIGNLTSLEQLDIGSNKIENLPDTICNLKLLKCLDISFNKLKKIPDGISNLTLLKNLYLYENELTELPNSIMNLKNLNCLDLFRLKLGGLIMRQIQKYRRTGDTSNLPESFLKKCVGGRYVKENDKKRRKRKQNIIPRDFFEKNKCSIIGETDEFLIVLPKNRRELMYFTSFEENEEVFWSINGSNYLWEEYIRDGNLFYCVYFYNKNPFLGKKIIIQYDVKDDKVYTWLPNHEKEMCFGIFAYQLRRNYYICKEYQEPKQLFFDFYFDNVIIDNKKITDDFFLLQLLKKAYENIQEEEEDDEYE
jgi:Leucine-rich repeat (LRR) protein